MRLFNCSHHALNRGSENPPADRNSARSFFFGSAAKTFQSNAESAGQSALKLTALELSLDKKVDRGVRFFEPLSEADHSETTFLHKSLDFRFVHVFCSVS